MSIINIVAHSSWRHLNFVRVVRKPEGYRSKDSLYLASVVAEFKDSTNQEFLAFLLASEFDGFLPGATCPHGSDMIVASSIDVGKEPIEYEPPKVCCSEGITTSPRPACRKMDCGKWKRERIAAVNRAKILAKRHDKGLTWEVLAPSETWRLRWLWRVLLPLVRWVGYKR